MTQSVEGCFVWPREILMRQDEIVMTRLLAEANDDCKKLIDLARPVERDRLCQSYSGLVQLRAVVTSADVLEVLVGSLGKVSLKRGCPGLMVANVDVQVHDLRSLNATCSTCSVSHKGFNSYKYFFLVGREF